jgi:succinate-acetate transporter protein
VTSRRALGALFAVLTILFALIAYAAFDARVWVIAFAAAALGLWMAGMAVRGLLSR